MIRGKTSLFFCWLFVYSPSVSNFRRHLLEQYVRYEPERRPLEKEVGSLSPEHREAVRYRYLTWFGVLALPSSIIDMMGSSTLFNRSK